MLDICLLGTGGMMPLPYRHLTSLMMRYNGCSILIDCGEGTQIAIAKRGWSPKPIDIICFTHYHADHISGIIGLLLAMGNADRVEPVTLIGPKGLTKVITGLRVIAPELPFKLNFIEISELEQSFDFGDFRIDAFRANHNIVCYGYSLSIDRVGKFDVERAKALNIPIKCWSRLQNGEELDIDGVIYTPDMVLGPDRKGIKVTYCTDSRPTDMIVKHAEGSDLFVCEGMYGEPGMEQKAKEHKHMTFYEAADMAKTAAVKELWLTHYSPSLNYPKDYEAEAQKIFAKTYTCKDGKSVELNFEED